VAWVLVSWLVGWLVGWLPGWLTSWPVAGGAISGSGPLATNHGARWQLVPVQPSNAVVVIAGSDCMWNAKTRSQFVIVLFYALRAAATVYLRPHFPFLFRAYPAL